MKKLLKFWPVQFSILLGAASFAATWPAAAYDFSAYLVTKGQEFTQTNSGLPAINSANGYVFEADVVLSGSDTITNCSIQPPAGVAAEALTLSSSGSKLSYKHKSNILSAINKNYPDGAYSFTIASTNDGVLQPSLQLMGSVYPPAPHLQNFSAAQSVNANGYFDATWDPFTGGTTNDFVQLHIEDLAGNKVFETPDVEKPGALDGTATNALVPPGALTNSQTYNARVIFQRAVTVDRTTYPGILGEAGYYARTTFSLSTTAAVAPDVEECEIAKANKWIQTDTNVLILETGHEFSFSASVQAYNSGILSTGTVLLPPSGASSRSLALQSGGTSIAFTDVASTQTALDSLYAAGTYSLAFATPHDGAKSLSIALPADNYPPAPRFANFDALQAVIVSQPFTVTWDPWVGGGPSDLIVVRIEDHLQNKFFESPDLGENNALSGEATSIVIPANTLPAGQTFEIHVTFIRVGAINTAAYPGVLLLSDFQTRTKINTQAIANDVASYSVFKRQVFSQTDPGAPVPAATNAFIFDAQVVPGASNSVTSAEVTTPLNSQSVLAAQSGGQPFYFGASFATQSALDSAYPNGNYLLNVVTLTSGSNSLPLTLAADLYPNAPHVANFAPAQLVDPSVDFTLNWDPFGNGTAGDCIQLTILDGLGNTVFQTAGYGTAGVLSGTATNTVISAGTLASNEVYYGELLFTKIAVLDTTTFPGAQGYAGYACATQFRLVTRGPGQPPLLSLSPGPSQNQYQLSAQVVPGLSYRVEGSSNLLEWFDLTNNTAVSNQLQWEFPTTGPTLFFRLVLQP